MTEADFDKEFKIAKSMASSGQSYDIDRALAYIALKAINMERFGVSEKEKFCVCIALSNTIKHG